MASLAAAALWPAAIGAAETLVVGDYRLEVSFRDEPPYLEEANAVELRVRDASGAPVLDAHRTIDLVVSARFREQDLVLRPLGEEPGAYEAPFIPPFTGEFEFRVSGEIEGLRFDEVLTTGGAGLPNIVARTSNDYTSPGAFIAYGSLLVYLVGLGVVAYWFYGRHHRDRAAT